MREDAGFRMAALVVILAQVATTAYASNALNLTVLYESLCYDSMRFIRQQLYPTFLDLKDHLNIEFVPYGKASFREKPWSMTCQHGARECLGNAIQACALSRIPDADTKVKFIYCVMSDNYPPGVGERCARHVNFDYTGVEACARNEEGKQLLMQHGQRTFQLKEDLRFVPTIIKNNQYDDDFQNLALYNLKRAICNDFDDPLPEKCLS